MTWQQELIAGGGVVAGPNGGVFFVPHAVNEFEDQIHIVEEQHDSDMEHLEAEQEQNHAQNAEYIDRQRIENDQGEQLLPAYDHPLLQSDEQRAAFQNFLAHVPGARADDPVVGGGGRRREWEGIQAHLRSIHTAEDARGKVGPKYAYLVHVLDANTQRSAADIDLMYELLHRTKRENADFRSYDLVSVLEWIRLSQPANWNVQFAMCSIRDSSTRNHYFGHLHDRGVRLTRDQQLQVLELYHHAGEQYDDVRLHKCVGTVLERYPLQPNSHTDMAFVIGIIRLIHFSAPSLRKARFDLFNDMWRSGTVRVSRHAQTDCAAITTVMTNIFFTEVTRLAAFSTVLQNQNEVPESLAGHLFESQPALGQAKQMILTHNEELLAFDRQVRLRAMVENQRRLIPADQQAIEGELVCNTCCVNRVVVSCQPCRHTHTCVACHTRAMAAKEPAPHACSTCRAIITHIEYVLL